MKTYSDVTLGPFLFILILRLILSALKNRTLYVYIHIYLFIYLQRGNMAHVLSTTITILCKLYT